MSTIFEILIFGFWGVFLMEICCFSNFPSCCASPEDPHFVFISNSLTPASRYCGNKDCFKYQSLEKLENGKSYKILDLGQNIGDDTPDFIIGKDEYFFLGDNRDNSLDSRFDRQFGGVGLVPKEYLIGKASLILFSSSGSSIFYFWSWRKDRFFKGIR